MVSPAITVSQLSYAYPQGLVSKVIHRGASHRQESVFSDFSLQVEAGKTTCILGHNGAGKTTLLNLVYGLLIPQSGAVAINPHHAPHYRDIFLFAGDTRVNRDMSARQVLKIRSMFFHQEFDQTRIDALLDGYHFHKNVDVPIKKLSAGNKVRSAFLVSLASEPTLLLLDEPTNSIDPQTRKFLRTTLMDLHDEHASIVLVTHDLEFAHAVSDCAVVLEHGRIVHTDDAVKI